MTLIRQVGLNNLGHANGERQANQEGKEGVARLRGALKGSQGGRQALPQGSEVARFFPQSRRPPEEVPF